MTKGTRITRSECEAILCMKSDNPKYGLKLMSLKDAAQKQLENEGVIASICIKDGGLFILDDASASEYHHKHISQAADRIKRNYRGLARVDTGELTNEQLEEHTSRLRVSGRFSLAIDLAVADRLPTNTEPTTDRRPVPSNRQLG